MDSQMWNSNLSNLLLDGRWGAEKTGKHHEQQRCE